MNLKLEKFVLIGYVFNLIFYLCVLFPLVQFLKLNLIVFPIVILLHTILFCGLVLFYEKKHG